MRHWILAACTLVMISGASSASAVMISGVTIDDFSSQFSGTRAASLLVDGSGLSSDSVTFTPSPTGPYHFAAQENRHWHTALNDVVGAYVTFDLGAPTFFNEIRIWNHNWTNFLFRGFDDFQVDTSLNGTTFTSLGSYSLNAASGANAYIGELISASATTRYVRFTVLSAQPGNDGYVGLSEVQFFNTPGPVPEPGSASLLGIGLAAFAVRRRKRRTS